MDTDKVSAPKVKVIKKERKLSVFNGDVGPQGYRIWKEEALSAIESLGYTSNDQEAAKHIYGYLGPDCKREVRLAHGDDVKNSADELFTALGSIYGDKRSLAQRRTAFYNCSQKDHENILDFSHRLLGELEAVAELDNTVKDELRTSMLVDQFTESVRDRQLRWELRKKRQEVKKSGEKLVFKDIRQVAFDWSEELGEVRRSSRSSRTESYEQSSVQVEAAAAVSPEVETRFRRIESKLEEHSSALGTMLSQQAELISELKNIKLNPSSPSYGPRCYSCNRYGHFKRDCQARARRQSSGNEPLPTKTPGPQ